MPRANMAQKPKNPQRKPAPERVNRKKQTATEKALVDFLDNTCQEVNEAMVTVEDKNPDPKKVFVATLEEHKRAKEMGLKQMQDIKKIQDKLLIKLMTPEETQELTCRICQSRASIA